ncbi:MAG: alkaline phosphatase family protein [Pyrinomonadaceae bacterium]|nr:alkaline phosphatase family protein [Sphingobacteriaceae bacterium]
MKLNFLLTTLLFQITFFASAQKQKTSVIVPRPKLVVGIVVDQMRWDYLYRFYDRYQEGGFKRLLSEGFSCDNTNIDYLPTETAPGHACIYTGSVPAIHGITGNFFYVQASGRYRYCTEDSTVQSVGTISKAGLMSPANLLASTITDELKLATNFRSKVIGVALKDRGSILPAGHTPDGAYWFDDITGNWITSTYYMPRLPEWVKHFNDQKLAENYLARPWNTLYALSTYQQSTPDNVPYEQTYLKEKEPVFPHQFQSIEKNNFSRIRSNPYGNTFTLDFAKSAIDAEQLGKDHIPDFLTISLSSPDYIGHQFGPNSVEVEDTYLRLDKELASFFTYLDTEAGKGNYTLFLTADHGVAHNAGFASQHKLPAGIWNAPARQQELNQLLSKKYQVNNLVLSMESYQVNLNKASLVANSLDAIAVKQDCIDWLAKQEGVVFAVDMKRIHQTAIPAGLREQMINGYNSERSGDIKLILKPGWYSSITGAGSTHGVNGQYDTHIPLVIMGWGIKKGTLNRQTHMTDISATLAALLHIQAPNGCMGQVISEALDIHR